jgi:hypothetical protein
MWYTAVVNNKGPAMAPNPVSTEKNARRLVSILALFSTGASCEELHSKFGKITSLGNATFYYALKYAKEHSWVIGGGGAGREYTLNPSGCWRPPGAPPPVERPVEHVEHLLSLEMQRTEKLEAANRRLVGSRRTIANGQAAGTAIEALVTIMQDIKVSMRRRVQAAEGLLQYKTPEDIANQAKLFLASVFMDPDQDIDHRLAATSALRRSEDPRVMTEIIRPFTRSENEPESEEVKRERAAEMQRRHEHLRKMDLVIKAEVEASRQLSDYRYLAPTSSDENS